jgi:hypothetical protein
MPFASCRARAHYAMHGLVCMTSCMLVHKARRVAHLEEAHEDSRQGLQWEQEKLPSSACQLLLGMHCSAQVTSQLP